MSEIGILRIGNCAFQGCHYLKRLVFPGTLRYVGYGAFCQCKSLNEISFEYSDVERIEAGAFCECPKLNSIALGKAKYRIEDDCLKDSKKNILFYLGSNNGIREYIVPNSEYIYPFAYYGHFSANKVIIAQRKIGSFAFEGCKIQSVVAKSVEDFGERSFYRAGIEKVFLYEMETPGKVWSNSFDQTSCFIVPESSQDQYITSRDWKDLNVWSVVMKKNKNLLCGNACLSYIVKKEGLEHEAVPKRKLFWITELASVLRKAYGMDLTLYYYDSRLIRDYQNENVPNDHVALKSVQNYVDLQGELIEKKMTAEELKSLIAENSWVILCLQSDILFRDHRLSGNSHFAILDKAFGNGVYIISPGEDNYYRIFLTDDRLMAALENNGQWILKGFLH